MPGLSGFDVLRRIKADPTLAFLPVILQTAVGAAASVQEGLAAGAFYYLTKPFSRDMLLAVGLAELMDEHQELTSKALMRVLKWSQAYERMNILLEQVNALAETIEEAVLKNV